MRARTTRVDARGKALFRLSGSGALALAIVVLSSCAAPAAPDRSSGTGAPSPSASAGDEERLVPSEHVHGAAFNPADGDLYLATHDGLFRDETDGFVRVGPQIDLMGFAVEGPDRFYASGHPGPNLALPNPVGLIASSDGGDSWTGVSREGLTDFHALAVTSAGVVGFDGSDLLTSPDGRTWHAAQAPSGIHALAASPDGTVLVATTPEGVLRSRDAGASWELDPDGPLLMLSHFVDATTVVAVNPDGAVYVSSDAADSWTYAGEVGDVPQAIAARHLATRLEIVVVTSSGVLTSTDGGASFGPRA
ncbi:F510_1955 family glycosylhydrolase [Actinotalea ferrariae]|uniref:F510_1955 family glycosylhydrolase n=1 Tax=Actinotalea ferrariae TaxID=1386098 RepID=UPI0035AB6D11